MPSEAEIEHKFWKSLKSDRTLMLGVAGEGHTRPMTAQLEDDRGPIWIFSSTDTELVQSITSGRRGA
ncbi:MAG: pyridoxamine 5'-phosphate oxidase family protein, partial [Hyphomonadaceae bacterium]|nr:pyridoxamine 5'-phosphate oxidase family protein [Hyphomonadaceae bacterium]